MSEAQVRLYSTTCAGTLKVRSDILRIKNLLDAKRVQYDEVRRAPITSHFNFCCRCGWAGPLDQAQKQPWACRGSQGDAPAPLPASPSYRRPVLAPSHRRQPATLPLPAG